MVILNRITSMPNSVLRYVVDKGLNFFLEFHIHPSLTSQIKVGRERVTQFDISTIQKMVSSMRGSEI